MNSDTTTDTSSAKPAQPDEDNIPVRIRVTVHETKIGCLKCALGHEQTVPLHQARALVAIGRAEIIGA
jgi:hypothetical protein